MGSWGIKALDSDEGLDIIDLFKTFVKSHPNIEMKDLVAFYKANGFLPNGDKIDYIYDKTAIGLVELYFAHKDSELFLAYKEPLKIISFSAGKADLNFLLQYLEDIINEKPDEDGEREYTDLYRDSPGWQTYMKNLSERLNDEIRDLTN